MGTGWSLRIALAPGEEAEPLRPAIQAGFDAIVAEMSHWEADSAISRFNRAPAGSWHSLPSDFFTVLVAGLAVAEASGGAFDPTMGGLVDLWGFGPNPTPPKRQPDGEVAQALAASGHRRIDIDRPSRRALQPGGLSLDFSGIAKGYAVDRLAEHLLSAGHRHFLAEVGGELRGEGVRPDAQPWWVELEAPPGAGALPAARIALHGLAVATSGDYRRFFDEDGRRYAHTLDPRHGWPIDNGVTSVTVVHRRAMLADAWATALTVLGAPDGLSIATKQSLAARFVLSGPDGMTELFTPAMAAMLD